MLMQLFVLVFTLAIIFVQSLYGLFSGAIMAFCTIAAAAVSFGCYEALNDFASTMIHPSYSAAGSMIVLFVLTLLVLRLLADTFIRGNVRVPPYVDWGGGAALGFVTAQLTMGVLVTSFLMLPLGHRVMMFQRYAADSEGGGNRQAEFARSKLWLNPDGFTAGLVSLLSNGSLKTETSFASVYPNMPDWVWFTGNTVQKESMVAPARDGGDGHKGLRLDKWWEQKQPVEARIRTKEPSRIDPAGAYEQRDLKAQGGKKLIGVRLEMNKQTGDRDRGQASQRFRPTMIRLVGESSGEPRQHIPVAIANADEKIKEKLRLVDMDDNMFNAGADVQIEAYFEVDPDFEPRFVEYRRFARASVDASNMSKTPPKDSLGATASTAGTPAAPAPSQQRAEGNMRFVDVIDTNASGERTQLPFPLNPQNVSGAGDAQFEEGKLASGRIFGDPATLRFDSDAAVRDLKAPEGQRILQIKYSPRKVSTTFGQVFNFASRLNQYFAVDSTTERHKLSGYYALVHRGGNEYFELFYSGEKDSPTYRNMLDFKEIKLSELTSDENAELGLIFIVPAGAKITAIQNQTGQGVTGLEFQMK